MAIDMGFRNHVSKSPPANSVQSLSVSKHQKLLSTGGSFCGLHDEKWLPSSSASGNEPCCLTATSDELYAGFTTPHSGYHFDGSGRNFFEGWYFKVSVPEIKSSFCFIYSVQNPAFKKKPGPSELARHGPTFTGVGVQILGPHDKSISQFSEDSYHFWGSRQSLVLGNTFLSRNDIPPPDKEVPPEDFSQMVLEGFQASTLCNQGQIRGQCCSDRPYDLGAVKCARWEYYTCPTYGWGSVGAKQKATAGWTAAFPVLEPHWQICMASGTSTGWIEWDGERYEFQNAPSYAEKNWGSAFPSKWFWLQCNTFQDANDDVTLTAGGGLKKVPGLGEYSVNAAMIGVHHGGIFYEFVPWKGVISWEIKPWGFWSLSAHNKTHKVELKVTTASDGTILLAPTAGKGMAPVSRDTCNALLQLRLWERRSDGYRGKVILDCTSDMAAAEVGGHWPDTWKGETSVLWLMGGALF